MAETIFDTSTLGTANNMITFNDDSGTIYYRLKSRMPQRRIIRENDIPLQEEMGIADFQTFIGKTMYILEGTMYPDDEDTFATGRSALRKLASLTVEQADTAADMGYVPYKFTDNVAKQIFMKVMYVDLPENSKQGIKQPFRLFCKVKFPAIYSQTAQSQLIGSSSSSTSASSLSFVLPKVLGASTYSSTGSAVNAGDLPVYPNSIVITGPVNIPKITNNTTGEYIEVNVNLASGSETLVISYDQDSGPSITKNGVSQLNNLTSGSTFFKIRSGTNNFTLSGSTLGSGAYAQINFYSAWPLS